MPITMGISVSLTLCQISIQLCLNTMENNITQVNNLSRHKKRSTATTLKCIVKSWEQKLRYAAKILGKEITGCDIAKWNSDAESICYPGILSKFQQNPGLANFLKNTGDRTILECCYDKVWGNGIPLSDPNCINPSKYTNQGIMGTILERVRDDLKALTENTPTDSVTMGSNNTMESS